MDYWQHGFFGSIRGKRIFDFWWHELREGMQCRRREGSLPAWVEGKRKEKRERTLWHAWVGIKKFIFGFNIWHV